VELGYDGNGDDFVGVPPTQSWSSYKAPKVVVQKIKKTKSSFDGPYILR
jgi:hypothetical protein